MPSGASWILRSSRQIETGAPPICWNCRMPKVDAQASTRSAASCIGLPRLYPVQGRGRQCFLKCIGDVTYC